MNDDTSLPILNRGPRLSEMAQPVTPLDDGFHVSLSELRFLWKLGKRGQEDGTLRGLLDTHMRLSVALLRENYWRRRALDAERRLAKG